MGDTLLAAAMQQLDEMGPPPEDGEGLRQALATAVNLLGELESWEHSPW